MFALSKIRDRQIALALLGFGVGCVALVLWGRHIGLGVRAQIPLWGRHVLPLWTRFPFDWLPDVDGVIACGVLGFFACIWQGLGYHRALSTIAPIVAIQLASCIRTRASMLSIAGLEAIIFGVVGIALTSLADPKDKSSTGAPDDPDEPKAEADNDGDAEHETAEA